jgi:hypothetical protein
MSSGTPSSCPCPQSQVPRVSNPPGLAQISDRVDDFTGFRSAMLRPRKGEQAISFWRPAPGDLGLQVLEWWAYLGDVLTFYNERLANESYLRTATQQGSVANLVALLGYEPAPGTAATGYVAAMRSAANPGEPLVIPAGMQLSSVPTPGVATQTFEVSTAASFGGPSSIPVTLQGNADLVVNSDGTWSVLLAGQVSGVKAGDQLLLAESGFTGTDDNWALVTVTGLVPQTDPGTGAINTYVTLSSPGWGPTPTPTQPTDVSTSQPAPPFRIEFAIDTPGPHATTALSAAAAAPVVTSTETARFITSGAFYWTAGMTAPPESEPSQQATSYRLMRPATAAALWNNQSATSADQVVVEPNSDSTVTVRLSAAVRAISPGDLVLFDCGAGTPSALAVVAAVAEEFWAAPYPPSVSPQPTPPNIVVAHTALTLTLAQLDSYALQDANVTAVAVRYGFKDVGTIIPIPQPSLPSLPAIVYVPESYTPPAPATAFLTDATGAGVLVTVSAAGSGQVTVTGAGNPPATISTPLTVPLQLLVDVVPVSRGTTVTGEVLGSGNAALGNQSFTLSKSPLTYLASGGGSVAALAVYVDQVEWQQVPSFFGQLPGARVFVVSRSPDQTVTTITFGDGVNGARLTSGTGNVTAYYRYGSGAASPPAGRLTAISQPQPNLAAIKNPVVVSPGSDPQAPTDVRSNAPASVFTFGRAISAVDYEVIASQAPGVSRVAAQWTLDEPTQRTMVTIYVDGGPAAVTAASAALAGSDDPNRPVSVIGATAIDLWLTCTLVVAADRQVPAAVAAATAAISHSADGLFSPAVMGIGQRLYRSAIDAALMVPGVVAVHNLTVTWLTAPSGGRFSPEFRFIRFLDEFFDPGESSFFDLPPGNVTMVGVSAGD